MSIEYPTTNRALLVYEFPLNEIMMNFYDRLKSISRGYASFDYELIDYREGELVKLDLLLNGKTGGCPLTDRGPGQCLLPGAGTGLQNQKPHPAANVRSGHPGCHRQQSDCP